MCYKCDGTGYIRAFSHVEGGVCFACGGSPKVGSGRTSIIPKEGSYGVASRLDGGKKSSIVFCKSWDDAYLVKQIRLKKDEYTDVRIVKYVNGQWLDRKQFLQSVG